MSRNKAGQGIVTDDKGQEQPADRDRTQTAHQTEPDRTRAQREKDDEIQPLREKAAFDIASSKRRAAN